MVFYPSCIYYCKYSEVAFPKYPLLTMLLMCSIHVEGNSLIYILWYIYYNGTYRSCKYDVNAYFK